PVDSSASVSSSSRSSGRSFGRYARAYANVIRKHAVPSCPVDGSPSRPAAAQALPAAVLDLDASPVLALVVEADFHLGGVGAVGSDVPEISSNACLAGHSTSKLIRSGSITASSDSSGR